MALYSKMDGDIETLISILSADDYGYIEDIEYCLDRLKMIDAAIKSKDTAIKRLTEEMKKMATAMKSVMDRVTVIERSYNEMTQLVNDLADDVDSMKHKE